MQDIVNILMKTEDANSLCLKGEGKRKGENAA
jgi:hypothetical protein